MATYVQVEIEPGSELLVEAPPSAENHLVEAGRVSELAAQATSSLAETVESIKAAGEMAISRVRGMEHLPDEVTLEFAVQLAAEAGVVIASTSASANLKITFKWVRGNGREAH